MENGTSSSLGCTVLIVLALVMVGIIVGTVINLIFVKALPVAPPDALYIIAITDMPWEPGAPVGNDPGQGSVLLLASDKAGKLYWLIVVMPDSSTPPITTSYRFYLLNVSDIQGMEIPAISLIQEYTGRVFAWYPVDGCFQAVRYFHQPDAVTGCVAN